MTKFKVGDKVKIREDLDLNASYDMEDSDFSEGVTDKMLLFCGELATICEVSEWGYQLERDSNDYNWTDGMFEGVVEEDFVSYKPAKPPLGVVTRDVFMQRRALELSRAIYEHLKADKKIEQEWLDELWELDEYIVGE